MQHNRNYDFAAGTTIVADQIDQEFNTIQGVLNGNIDTDNLKDVSVTEEKIASNAVTTAKIADDNVTAAKIENQEAWREVDAAGQPAFANSWVRYHASAYPTARFMKDSLGFVHLSGMIKGGTTGVPFTLPADYRPLTPEIFTCSTYNFAHCSCEISSSGVLTFVNHNNTWVSLDGIIFKAEA
jgi:hypothetical protein